MNLSDLKPAPFNPREIEDAAIKGLGTSIAEFGDISGIVWNRRNGYLVAGHQRLKVLLEQGYTLVHRASGDLWWLEQPHELGEDGDRFPIRIVDWPDAKHKAAMVVANSQLIAGVFLEDKLVDMVDELKESDLASLIEPLRLEELVDDMHPPVEVQQDEVLEPPKEPVTRLGDLWTMGEHRVLCGDSGSATDVDRLLDGASIHLINTDPPYNVNVEPTKGLRDSRGKRGRAARVGHIEHRSNAPSAQKMKSDFVSDEEYDRMLHAWFGNISRVLAPGRTFYIWGGYTNIGNYPAPLKAAGLYFSQAIIWDKQHPAMTRKDFMGAHEWCFYGWREGAAHVFLGPNNATDLWHVKKVNPQSMVHLTEKPVELAVRAIQYSSRAGENVLDLFGGSGSTLIAAEQTGRCAYLMELDTLYCDVIVQRFLNLTGESPIRESDGARFADLASNGKLVGK